MTKKTWKALVLAGIVTLAMVMAVALNVGACAADKDTQITGELGSGFRWSYDAARDTLTISGEGEMPELDLSNRYYLYWNQYTEFGPFAEIVIEDGVTALYKDFYQFATADKVTIGKDLKSAASLAEESLAKREYAVSEENPYFSSYDGVLYSKDYHTLIACPEKKTEIIFHDDVVKIGDYAFYDSDLGVIVIPWGVEEIGYYIHGYRGHYYPDTISTYVLPDTITVMQTAENIESGSLFFPHGYAVHYIYSVNSPVLETIQQNLIAGNAKEYDLRSSTLRTGESYVGKTAEELIRMADLDYVCESDTVAVFYGITANSFKTFGSRTYYFDENCKMVTGTRTINGKTYTFDADGVLQGEAPTVQDGLIYQDGKAYYYESGVMLRSQWVQVGNDWYYLNDYGAGVVNCWRLMNGKYYYLGSDGRMKKNQWIQDYGSWYWVDGSGARYESRWGYIDDHWYWFGGSGKMAESQWLKLADGKWYYFGSSGGMYANRWVKSGSYWYYLGSSGAMLTDALTPDGYRVDGNGVWVR